ncbi:glutathione peroxidase [Elstera cyanobacteriorum]|uniref:Glutathione peroxidase n=1 Tax=Elstera cyanobacteriorum TaxID=2022747 RepID=A0A255XR10_9PROT|nr:glutathione peroxidase [Elstera cyanobacteriorum]OYQ18794.1 glutathione peroxidase [Elstera cyanobacteriorum]GFZ77657.1 glutathione peroxidase [Elstera cyanobacteriorum]
MRRMIVPGLGVFAMLGFLGFAKADMPGSAYDFSFQSIDGQPLPLATFKGKAVLVVNTASQCGFTPQYKGLEALYDRYGAQGLIVLGVPSNDFGGQEPGQNSDIKNFCETTFDVSFPLTEKTHVTGSDAHPFYKWAAEKMGMVAKPRWNFHKYLIGPDGALVDWFSTVTEPTSPRVTKAIETLLPAKG